MSRLSWFPFYVDDFLGGTTTLSGAECGRYLLCLAAQWASAERGAVSAAPDKLRAICRGEDPGPDVLEKFQTVTINGQPYLRNERLWKEWGRAKAEYEGRKRGAERTNERAAQEDAERYTLKNNPQGTTDITQPTPAALSAPDNGTEHVTAMLEKQQQDFADEVWSAFLAKTGQPATKIISPDEYAVLKHWMSARVPLRTILTAIRETKGKGRHLGYYAPSVKEHWDHVRRATQQAEAMA